jgi:hypothetical protein
MKLGLGLDVRKASAPAFKGLLDKFTGAVAAYSTRKLTASQPNILPADYGDGAAAAYSLRKVKASYSGNCIDVRRSSDDTTSSIGFSGNELDTTALEAFVNEDVVVYTSDFRVIGDPPVDQEDLNESNGTGAGGQSVAGVDDAYLFTNTATGSCYPEVRNLLDVGQTTRIQLDYYIPSGQDCDMVILRGGSVEYTRGTTVGSWDSIDITAVVDRDDLFLFLGDGGSLSLGSTGNELYLKNIVITQTTADGFVTKWYDQSGTNHAEQATDNDQPQIVDAGSTILENGKPAIQFDGVDDTLLSSTSFAQPYTAFAVRKFDSASDQMLISHDTSTFYGVEFRFVATTRLSNGTYLNHSVSPTTTQGLLYALGNGSNSEISIDGGTTTTGNSGSAGASELSIGGRSSYYFNGALQEIIYFDSDQSDNRQDIEWNINNHYNIYTDSWDKQSAMEVRRAIDNETTNIGFVGKDLDTTALETFATESSPVLDDYTGAAAAYSLRKVRSAYTGSAVRVRRSSDDGLQDIGE